MKIKKLLKFGIISISSSIIFSSSLAFFGNGQANNFSMSSNCKGNYKYRGLMKWSLTNAKSKRIN